LEKFKSSSAATIIFYKKYPLWLLKGLCSKNRNQDLAPSASLTFCALLISRKVRKGVTPAQAGVQTSFPRKRGNIKEIWIPVFTGNPGCRRPLIDLSIWGFRGFMNE